MRQRERDGRGEDRDQRAERFEEVETEAAAEQLLEDRHEDGDREQIRSPLADARGIPELRNALLAAGAGDQARLEIRDRVRGDKCCGADEQSTAPRGGRAQPESLTEWEPTCDQQYDEQQDGVERDREDRARVQEKEIGRETTEAAQPQRIARKAEEEDEGRPDDDPDGVERSAQATACATRSGSSSASARSISSSVLK